MKLKFEFYNGIIFRISLFLYHELTTRSVAECNEAVNKVFNFMKQNGDPYITPPNTKLLHFESGQLESISSSDNLINVLAKDEQNMKVSGEKDLSQRRKS